MKLKVAITLAAMSFAVVASAAPVEKESEGKRAKEEARLGAETVKVRAKAGEAAVGAEKAQVARDARMEAARVEAAKITANEAIQKAQKSSKSEVKASQPKDIAAVKDSSTYKREGEIANAFNAIDASIKSVEARRAEKSIGFLISLRADAQHLEQLALNNKLNKEDATFLFKQLAIVAEYYGGKAEYQASMSAVVDGKPVAQRWVEAARELVLFAKSEKEGLSAKISEIANKLGVSEKDVRECALAGA